MAVLRQVRERFASERPLAGVSVAACLHVTAETANFVRCLGDGGAEVALCSANPHSTQDDTAAALAADGVEVRARRGDDAEVYAAHVKALAQAGPQITVDDGADLIIALHEFGRPEDALGGTEETRTGLLRLRRLDGAGALRCPVLAVNDSLTERAFNDRYGTGQSALDGILRATNLLLAGHTLVLMGYGYTGKGIAERARGAGAAVVVCEVDPLRALEARMAGYEVMPALDAAERGDVFVTVTGSRDVLRREHFERMKDGAVLANAGHFNVEISLPDLLAAADGRVRQVLPLIEEYDLGDRRLNLLTQGRVVNLAAGEGHPATVMDISFAGQALAIEHLVRHGADLGAGVHEVPLAIDEEVARLKLEALGLRIDAADARAGGLPRVLGRPRGSGVAASRRQPLRRCGPNHHRRAARAGDSASSAAREPLLIDPAPACRQAGAGRRGAGRVQAHARTVSAGAGRVIAYHSRSKRFAGEVRRAARAWNSSGIRIRWKAVPASRARIHDHGLAQNCRQRGSRCCSKVEPERAGARAGASICSRTSDRGWRRAEATQWPGVAHEMGHIMGLHHEDRRCA